MLTTDLQPISAMPSLLTEPQGGVEFSQRYWEERYSLYLEIGELQIGAAPRDVRQEVARS